ncbi:hypothetical protein [Bradyrhizobium ottawaense]|uniref:hypothetical protein n=1 Tax=Bradyrhizobium ottawaense TaxID=931866 RepID=UPI001BADC215|nr:hypothetical protein [Bradyrhizobium ottawaense]MBR1362933.1 hypothetical protein [Bradyrhizobium ottawaense]
MFEISAKQITFLPTVSSSTEEEEMSIEENEREDQTGKPISFRAPPALAKAIEQAAGKELLSAASYCRRAVWRAVQAQAR